MSNLSDRIAALSPEKRELLVQQLYQQQNVAPTKIQPRGDNALTLSFAQQRLWFLERLEPGNPFYNIPAAVRLKGDLNVAALQQSLNEIIRRHEVLRTAFDTVDGQPVLAIAPSLSLTLPILDLRQLPETKREQEVLRLAKELAQTPFDLQQPPLLRVSLLHLCQSEYAVLFAMHHIVSDGWSMGVLIREVGTLYEAFATGKPSPLPKLPIQYADFAFWQRQWLQRELDTQMTYWKKQLGGSIPVLDLPTDRPRPAVQIFSGAVQTFILPKTLTEAVTKFSLQEETTLFITLLAAFKTLLYRYTGQTDILVGSPIANRDRIEIEGLIGLFINTLVLRTDLTGNPSFQEVLRRVREVALGAYAHQNLPFEKLVEELQPERNLSHAPLFQVMFVLQNAPSETLELSGLTLQPIEVDTSSAKFDLTLVMSHTEQGLTGALEYNTHLFEATTISRMLGHFQTLLSGIVANPQQSISDLPLLSKLEQQQLLVEWNEEGARQSAEGTGAGLDLCIHELFEAQVERTPDAIAVVFENQQFTYRELNQRANQLARHLQKLGVQLEVLVGICVERSLEMVIGLLGILKAGGAYVPLDPAYPQERLAFMLSDAQVSVLIAQSQLLAGLPEHQAQVVCLDTDWQEIAQQSDENLVSVAVADNLAYVIYTSGSTGKPKGVQIPHSALTNFLNAMRLTLGLTGGDTFLSVTTLSFDIAALELYLPLVIGDRLVIVSREVATDGTQLLAQLVSSGATVMQATPATWRLLLAAGWQGRWKLKILCGGEALDRLLANQLVARGTEVWNLYGPTETTIWSSAHKVEPQNSSEPHSIVAIGRPIANTQFYVLDNHLQPVPISARGELHIGGAGLARGYLNQPQLTAEKFISNPFNSDPTSRLYKTGDLVRYRPDGTLEYQERCDRQVKVRGFRIELREIEAVLSQYPGVRTTVVVVREDKLGSHLVAYLVPEPDAELENSAIRRFLEQQLPQYMVPTAFVILEALPLTPNGKVDRRALPAPATTELEKIFAAPRTPIQEVLAGIWVDILGLAQAPSIHDNFFHLGGHSLLATQLISRIRSVFQVELPLRWLFESPTVAQLSDRLNQAISATQKLTTPPIERISQQQLPLSFAQQRLWFLDQLQPNNAAYNIAAAVRLVGSLNIFALEQSLNEIIRRHAVLRTTFTVVDGQPVQVIAPTLTIKLPLVDLQLMPTQEAEVLRLAAAEAQLPFNLEQDALLRGTLLKLGEAEHIVLFTMHHIVSDGWSTSIITKEISALYTAFATGNPSPLPELAIQYGDFAYWQRQWLQGEVLENLLSYWQQQLAGASTTLDLPKIASSLSSSNAPEEDPDQSFLLSPHLSQQLRTLSNQEGVTLFMTLLAILQTLLYRYTNQDDIVVGTDVANRDRSEIEPLIGFFVNLLVLRTHLSGNPSFRELLARVREVALGAYAHQDLPFAKLVEVLQPNRTTSHTPLFQVLFVFQNTPTSTLELTNLTLSPVDINTSKTKFDLVLFIEETQQGIVGTWQYNTDIFHPAIIKRMSNNFETLANNAAAQPDTKINALEILTETEKTKQITQQEARKQVSFQQFKSVKPKTISLPQGQLVKTDSLQQGKYFPLLIQPNFAQIDLADWAKNHREFIEANLLKYGAILFRGFNLTTVPEFENFAQAICPELFGEYGDLPREGISGKVYSSTPYPPDKAILFHNESSHLHQFPQKIWFFCVQPAQKGGETPIIDCRQVYQRLNPKLREKFEQKQLMYVRNYIAGLDVSWQDFFHTTDKAVVEEYCRQAKIDFEWLADNNLRTRQIRPAVSKHPKTGELVFFNQLQLHHVSCLESNVRQSLLSMFGEKKLPRNVYYGDGSAIEDSVIAEIEAVYQELTSSFLWQQGDILMLDNMLAAHGRNPYEGSRKIVVAMGEIIAT
ncbi:MAG: amino acid adenylation domain-containing protein [Gloeocapsa sp. UFS-A4-WI-NPMV-4B04]|jgi:amino acid adenylation domain-containing protein|nr:amino acid adenylation domain-containing protein [Gloeocapsa sp. UFS-A4-WI-NPMV-4B04]